MTRTVLFVLSLLLLAWVVVQLRSVVVQVLLAIILAAGMTPLLIASANGHEELSLYLLEQGADPRAADPNGMTAMHYAIQKGASHIAAVQLDSLDAMAYMFRPNMVKLVEALLKRGADPNAKVSKPMRLAHSNTPRFSMLGATPFLLAAGSYDASLMRLLVEHGADPKLGTSVGRSDIYPAAYHQQWIDVAGLRGCFVYRMTVDPGEHLFESNENDNTSQRLVRLPYRGEPGC